MMLRCGKAARGVMPLGRSSRVRGLASGAPVSYALCTAAAPATAFAVSQFFTRGATMSLRINDEAPNFKAKTTKGDIDFHQWIGDQWAVLFSHPKDFTPVCTTELGYMAKIEPEFDKRNVKIIGLSVDSTGDHEKWSDDIEETQGARPKYPIIGDADFHVSQLYG